MLIYSNASHRAVSSTSGLSRSCVVTTSPSQPCYLRPPNPVPVPPATPACNQSTARASSALPTCTRTVPAHASDARCRPRPCRRWRSSGGTICPPTPTWPAIVCLLSVGIFYFSFNLKTAKEWVHILYKIHIYIWNINMHSVLSSTIIWYRSDVTFFFFFCILSHFYVGSMFLMSSLHWTRSCAFSPDNSISAKSLRELSVEDGLMSPFYQNTATSSINCSPLPVRDLLRSEPQ